MSRLEEDVKVDQFRNSRHRLLVNLMYTHNWMTAHMQAVFKSFGVTNQQYNILRILRGSRPEPCTIQLLKERMLDKQPDVSRLVDRLQTKGLVGRRVNKQDRRKMDVEISAEGMELLAKMEPAVDGMENLFQQLDAAEVEQINELLDKIRFE